MMDGKHIMQVGDVVRYRNHAYRVGVNRSNTSIELIELNAPTMGLWVSRDEVSPASYQTHAVDSDCRN